MLKLKNCDKCGRMFQGEEHQKLCSRCNTDADNMFDRVRSYVYDNPDENISAVSEGTGVHKRIILKYIKEGKLIIENPDFGAECERCGKSIDSGRFCAACAHELKQGLSAGLKEDEPKKSHAGMFVKKR